MADSLAPWVWAPNPARSIPLWDVVGDAPIGRLGTALPLRWPDKPAAAVLDYTLDATALQASASDVVTATVHDTAGLTLPAVLVQGGLVTLWLGGGTDGQDAGIFLIVTTASGRLVSRIVRLAITP